MVVVIPLTFREQEDVFMRPSRTICHALGHGIRFCPHDVRAEIPAVRLKGERHAPGDADEVFGLDTIDTANAVAITLRSTVDDAVGTAGTWAAFTDLRAARITVTEVQPHRPVIAQHALDFTEDLDDRLHVGVGRRLQADLTSHAVVAQAPIRRARAAA